MTVWGTALRKGEGGISKAMERVRTSINDHAASSLIVTRSSLRCGVWQPTALVVGWGVEHRGGHHAVEGLQVTRAESELQAEVTRIVNGTCCASVKRNRRRSSVGRL